MSERPIANKYREGKMTKTLKRKSKVTLEGTLRDKAHWVTGHPFTRRVCARRLYVTRDSSSFT